MEAFAFYLIKSVVWLSGFALVYALFLRNERFFTLNRIFLVTGILISIIFPFFTWHYTVVIPVIPIPEVSDSQIQGTVAAEGAFQAQNVLLFFYLAGIIFLTYRLFRQTIPVFRVIRKSEAYPINSIKLIRTDEYPASFSFISFVFVNPSIGEIETREIVNHEQEHIRQKHWIDLLLFEVLCTMQWFNPVSWLYGRMIRQNHEYLADKRALQHSSNPAVYRAALLNQMFGGPVISLANSFNYSLNKKRFNMMKHTIQSPIRKLKLLFILPFIVGILYAFATPEYKFIQSGNTSEANKIQQQTAKVITGKVVSEDGKPLKSASVIVSGKTIGTITDADGNFKLELTDDSPIVISYVGFESQKKVPNFEKEMLINMKTKPVSIEFDNKASEAKKNEQIDLNESNPLVIVDGKEIFKADMVKINPDKIEKIEVLKNQESIEKYGEKGKDGVILITLKPEENSSLAQTIKVQTNSPIKFRNLDGSETKPLIVKDGIILENQNVNDIPPESIESISVLKGEQATKLFGEKGKNGVIEIQSKSTNQPFFLVEEMPEFPGGQEALRSYIAATLQYPKDALEKGISGKVFVNFIVAKDGSVTDAKIARGVDPSLDKEALRIVNRLPRWKPGSQAGEPVRVSYTVPINFKLPAEKISKEELKTKSADISLQKNKLIIVPNPTNDKVRITLDGSDSKTKLAITVLDTNGNLIKKETKNGPSFTMSFAGFTSGTYLIVASDGTNQFSGQLVVNH